MEAALASAKPLHVLAPQLLTHSARSYHPMPCAYARPHPLATAFKDRLPRGSKYIDLEDPILFFMHFRPTPTHRGSHAEARKAKEVWRLYTCERRLVIWLGAGDAGPSDEGGC